MTLDRQYLRYVRDCAHWQLPAQSFEDFKAYWEMFARDGEIHPPVTSLPPSGKIAPTIVHKFSMQGQPRP